MLKLSRPALGIALEPELPPAALDPAAAAAPPALDPAPAPAPPALELLPAAPPPPLDAAPALLVPAELPFALAPALPPAPVCLTSSVSPSAPEQPSNIEVPSVENKHKLTIAAFRIIIWSRFRWCFVNTELNQIV